MKIKESSSVGFVEPQLGIKRAIIKAVIDCGKSVSSFKNADGTDKVIRTIMITFAFPTDTHVLEEGQAPQMLTSSVWLTASLDKRSNMFAFINAVTGKSPEADYDPMTLLNANCEVNVTEVARPDGTKRIKVTPLQPATDNTIAIQVNKFDFDHPLVAEFQALSEGVQEKIKTSEEYAAWEANGFAPF